MIVHAGHERLRGISAQSRAGQADQTATEIGRSVRCPALSFENERAISAAEQAGDQTEDWNSKPSFAYAATRQESEPQAELHVPHGQGDAGDLTGVAGIDVVIG